jgi:hypothetical protein
VSDTQDDREADTTASEDGTTEAQPRLPDIVTGADWDTIDETFDGT